MKTDFKLSKTLKNSFSWLGQKIKQIYMALKRLIAPAWRKHRASFWFWFQRLALGLVGIFVIYLGYLFFTLPDVTNISQRVQNQPIKYFDRTGKNVLYESYVESKRIQVKLADINPYVIQATIAIEDKGFYQHSGFDFRGILRSIFVNVTSLSLRQGASTLTQQLVKNAILTNERVITRKLRELMLSMILEQKYSKDQILEMYLNEISYGGNINGIEGASQVYFKKSSKDLSLAEAAILAGIPQRPSFYYPYGANRDQLLKRQKLILDLMVEQGYIKPEEAAKAKEEKISFVPRVQAITAPHFIFYVRDQLEEKLGAVRVEQGGFSVITTLDSNWQKIAEDAVAKRREKNLAAKASNAAVVAMDVASGEVRAMVGSADYFDDTIDGNVNVATRRRQPGSSIKPFIFALGFAEGLTPNTILFDLTTKFINTDGQTYTPVNYDGKERGPVTLREALALSLNIPAVKTLYLVTLPKVLDLLPQLGYTTLGNANRYGLSLVLGGLEVTLLEHTNAYAALAREGVYAPFAVISRVEDFNGQKLWARDPNSEIKKEVLPVQAVRQLDSVLSDNQARSAVFGVTNYLTLPDRPVAAKTGTTNSYIDAWTMGYIPQAVVGVWVGNNDGTQMNRVGGSLAAAPIWQDVMTKISKEYPVVNFNTPDPVVNTKAVLLGQGYGSVLQKVDLVTGQIIPPECVANYPAEYITEAPIQTPISILNAVVPGDLKGPAPKNPAADKQFQAWNEPIQEWAKKNNQNNNVSIIPSCDWRNNNYMGSLELISPSNNQNLIGPSFTPEFTLNGNTFDRLQVLLDGESVYAGTNPRPNIIWPLGLSEGLHDLTLKITSLEKNIFERTVQVQLSGLSAGPVNFSWNQDSAQIPTVEGIKFKVENIENVTSFDCYAKNYTSTQFVTSMSIISGENTLPALPRLSPGLYELNCRLNLNSAQSQVVPSLNLTVN